MHMKEKDSKENTQNVVGGGGGLNILHKVDENWKRQTDGGRGDTLGQRWMDEDGSGTSDGGAFRGGKVFLGFLLSIFFFPFIRSVKQMC